MHACIQRREHARTRRCKHVDAQMHGPRLIALRRKQRLRVEATILAIPAEPHGFARLHVGIVELARNALVQAFDHLDAGRPKRGDPAVEGFARHHSAASVAAWLGRPSRYFSASSAAMQPSPAAVTAWRKISSATSPAANTPGI